MEMLVGRPVIRSVAVVFNNKRYEDLGIRIEGSSSNTTVKFAE